MNDLFGGLMQGFGSGFGYGRQQQQAQQFLPQNLLDLLLRLQQQQGSIDTMRYNQTLNPYRPQASVDTMRYNQTLNPYRPILGQSPFSTYTLGDLFSQYQNSLYGLQR